MSTRRIGLAQGTAIYVGAILGAGILVLPALAAKAAGPASVLAWGLLLVLCVPVAGTFAALGSRYPDGGGIATFIYRAFGRRASAVVGYWFYFVLPVGLPAGGYISGQYLADAFGGGDRAAVVSGTLLVTAAVATNLLGLQVSARIQLILVWLLAALLLVACAAALREAHPANLTPFAPHGYCAIGPATSLLFFSFAGWEAVTHLSGEFRDPRKDLRRATVLTLIVITVLFLGVAMTSVLVLGPRLPDTAVPITRLLAVSVGGAASVVTATLAALLTFGTMNAYFAGASKLGAALARDGALPLWLAKGNAPGQVPRRSLSVIVVLATAVAAVAIRVEADLSQLLQAASACLLVVTLAGLVAGIKLLPRRRPTWWGAVFAAVTIGVVTLFAGLYLAYPLGLALAALLYTGSTTGRANQAPLATPAADAAAVGPATGQAPVPAGCSATRADPD